MSVAEPARSREGAEPPEVLRAKYHDYCSAQLADLLLFLTPDDIFLLAQKAARDEEERPAATYAEMVDVATAWLSRKVALPPFDVWVEDYLAHPRLYEEYFMGLWESDVAHGSDKG